MGHWYKYSQEVSAKIRFKTDVLLREINKMKKMILQKRDISEGLTAVDFSVCRIENKIMQGQIEKKTTDYIALKKKNAAAQLELAEKKKHLLKSMTRKSNLKTCIETRKKKMENLMNEVEQAAIALEKSAISLNRVKGLQAHYTVKQILYLFILYKVVFNSELLT